MEFLSKTFNSKEDLVAFVRDYCYNYGYVTFIRSSSKKDGNVRISCNCIGDSKEKGNGEPSTKKAKTSTCPFTACGRRIRDAKNNEPEVWQITIFNNSHNHMPVVDFKKPATLNLIPPPSGSGNNSGHTTTSLYNPDLDLYSQNIPTTGDSLTITSNLFNVRVIQNVHEKLKELSEAQQTIFLNRFNKLLYDDMPKYRDPNGPNICNHSTQPPPMRVMPTTIMPNPPPAPASVPAPVPTQASNPSLNTDRFTTTADPSILPTPAQVPDLPLNTNSNIAQAQEINRNARVCKTCGQHGHYASTCTSHLTLSSHENDPFLF